MLFAFIGRPDQANIIDETQRSMKLRNKSSPATDSTIERWCEGFLTMLRPTMKHKSARTSKNKSSLEILVPTNKLFMKLPKIFSF